jgi:nucleoside-diphosphate-sugar epimerase
MKALVCGAGGFIGSHLVKRLKSEGYEVVGVDIKYPEFSKTAADYFVIQDLRQYNMFKYILMNEEVDEVYQLAADMGGAGFVFSGENDADIMHNSAQINLNALDLHKHYKKIFYSSSACMYPEHNQLDPNNPNCEESSAYPANPDSEYGWEKLFSERLYLAYNRNKGVDVRIARFHNIFGPEGTWTGGREKSPAAFCRKIIQAEMPTMFGNGKYQVGSTPEMEMWGDGTYTRSYLYIDECIEGIRRLMKSDFKGPVNIGSEEMISMNDFAKMIMNIEGKDLPIRHIEGPLGVKGRNSDNRLIKEKLGWSPSAPLEEGIRKTYFWIKEQIEKSK